MIDELQYLNDYPDVANAISIGKVKTAQEHWDKYGRAEGRRAVILTTTPELLIEARTDSKKKKVIFITPGMGNGGAERWVKDLILNLDSSNFDIQALIIYYENSIDKDLLSPISSKTQIYAIGDYYRDLSPETIKAVSSITSLKNILNTADLIIFWGIGDIKPIRDLTKAKMCMVVHGSCEATKHITEKNRVYCSKIVFVSNYSRKKIGLNVESNLLKVIRNGVDSKRLERTRTSDEFREKYNISTSKRLIGYLGRINESKNVKQLISVMEQFDDRYHLIIAGTGKASIPASDRVTLIGEITNVSNFFNAIDVYVSLSFSEAFSYALLEAMYCECPIVVTETGGVSEITSLHGEFCYVLPTDPLTSEVAIKIREAIRRGKPSEMTKKSKEIVQSNFLLKHCIKEWKLLIEELL
jgi:glycosyltransferase involved in cell wall biosynthesis